MAVRRAKASTLAAEQAASAGPATAVVEPWGRTLRPRQRVHRMRFSTDPLPASGAGRMLAHGLGRSYGDVCLNEGGLLLFTRQMDRLVGFDAQRGLVRCEAGMSFQALLAYLVPRGWFLPVVPGTQHVTVGGAVANDIHGKNHHRAGTFGRHVTALGLARSDGTRLRAAPDENEGLYRATVGGLGLTGLMTWVEFRVKRVPGPLIASEAVAMPDLDAFFDLSADSQRNEYTVAWVDTTSRGRDVGRGVFFRGDHVAARRERPESARTATFSYPFDGPRWLLNPWSVRAFNKLYYLLKSRRAGPRIEHYRPFFFPLDGIEGWNAMYGPPGFFQYQFVVPLAAAREAVHAVFAALEGSPEKSFLSVLKVFGDVPSPGILSFPREGVTLALDLRNRGLQTLKLLDRLDGIVIGHGGRIYPAKDARMSAETFQRSFPEWPEAARFFDAGFGSSFQRRVTG